MISCPLVVIGASGETAGAPYTPPFLGHAYVLDTSTGLITPLTHPAPQTIGGFAYSVAVSGTTVVVGAPFDSVGDPALPHAGNAYVFDATDGALIATLARPTPQADGEFGFSVAVSGTTVVVGAPREDVFAGHAYVFDATSGSLITTLTSPSATTGSFGFSVAVSGTTVVVGAPGDVVAAQVNAGHAYVYDATAGFLTPTPLTSPYAQANGFFGSSVAVGGTTVVVGAPGESVDTERWAGHAYSFDASASFLTTTLTSPNPQTGHSSGGLETANFGFSVSVSEIDPIVVVGAPFESGGGYAGAGHAYIFS